MKLRFLAVITALAIAGCMTAPKSAQDKTALKENADTALATAKAADTTFANLARAAYGYAVFPSVGKGGVGLGAAYGQGILYEHGVFVGYCDLSQASIGFQFGGQSYTEIIVFESKGAADAFKGGDLTLAAQASAVALKSGAAANAKYSNGVAIFTMDQAGLMYEASVGGQKFSFQGK
jgi:lipid-binding SYLF domain-containing protein